MSTICPSLFMEYRIKDSQFRIQLLDILSNKCYFVSSRDLTRLSYLQLGVQSYDIKTKKTSQVALGVA